MRGRPKLDDSRDHQYRVRLNDEENGMLDYVSERINKAKSEILRIALLDYYNKVRLQEFNFDTETYEEIWEASSINLKRVVICPHCKTQNRVDLEDECTVNTDERPMGAGILYEFHYEDICSSCEKQFAVVGYISEYPAGALEHEEIIVTPIEDLSQNT